MSIKPELVVTRRSVTELDCLAALGRRISAHVSWPDAESYVVKGVVSGVVVPAPGSTVQAQLLVLEQSKRSAIHEGAHFELYADTITKLSVFEEVDLSALLTQLCSDNCA